MSLIDNVSPQPSEPTKEQQINQVKSRIKKMSQNIYTTMENRHQTIWDMIWNNEKELTPQEVLDAFDTDSYELFAFSANIQTMLAQAGSGYIPMDTPNEFVVNPDGTVTVGEPRAVGDVS